MNRCKQLLAHRASPRGISNPPLLIFSTVPAERGERLGQAPGRHCAGAAFGEGQKQWRSQDLEVGAQGVWRTEVPQRGPGAEPLVGGSGGIASRKLIAVIKGIWLPNHAQFCVFSSTAQPGIFL